MSILAGVLIDLDHLIDYYVNHKFTLNLSAVYDACVNVDLRTLHFPLHSYELAVLAWVFISAFCLGSLWVSAAAGFTQHIIADQISNPVEVFGYFFLYRLVHGFRTERIMKIGRRKQGKR